MLLDTYSTHLDSWFSEIAKLGLDITNLPLDHLGFSADSTSDYGRLKQELLSSGDLVREVQISNRRVAVFALCDPLPYQDYLISSVELMEPKAGETPKSGFEHAEFTIAFPFSDLLTKYPHLSWDTSNMARLDFPRLKLVLGNGTELKFNTTPILLA